jgi:nitrogen-specific signal transduction histidine kinase
MHQPTSQPTTDDLIALSRAVTTARLLSSVVHEINNALLVISGSVELLESRRDLSEPVARAIERIGRQTGRTAAAIAQVTAFTQATPGARTPMDLVQIAETGVEMRRFAVGRAGLSIEFVSESVPLRVQGNRQELLQMTLNMIICAEHALTAAAAKDRETPRQILVKVAKEVRSALLQVTYTVPPSGVEMLFEPFAAGRSAGDTSGLSLCAARAIAVTHHGSLQLAGAGETTLSVRLPLA